MPTWLYLSTALLGFGLLLGLELRAESFRAGSFGRRGRRRIRRNWQFLAAAVSVASVLRMITDALFAGVPPLFNWQGHGFLNLVGCFVVAELCGWFLHFIKHQHPFLWRFHFQHHIETRYDAWLVTHTHALEVLISGTAMSFVLVAVGFSPLSVQVYLLFYSLANTYQHSAFDYSLGWLDKIIVNPAYHRYHHAVGSTTNYGNTLTIWDVVFGTATWPKSAQRPDVVIGIGPGPEPYGFAQEMLYFARGEERPLVTEPEPTTGQIRSYVG